jgi:tetratricopeptide (TPR) repeat protein
MRQLLAVFLLLVALCCCTTDAERTQMRSGLDSLNQRNRTDQPFTVQEADSFVRFFDRHGTANDRLLAHYLLGRAYYEHGEAPMALECYHDALDCADTTAQDCDYAQLARVYAQLADLFYDQTLFRQQLTYEKLAEHYAWKGKDTLSAIQCYDSQSLAFSELGLTDSAIIIAEEASRLYEKYGYSDFAATTLGGISRLLIEKGDIAKARKYMNAYESKSGNFDESGNIEDGREMYYHFKGLLYIACANLDSAEYWFRKELKGGKDVYNQNGGAVGLGKVYDQRNMPDSAAKYYRYAYAMNDSAFMQMSTQSVGQIQAMYDYTRHQKIAIQESEKANRHFIIICICLGFIIIICLSTYIVIRELSRKKKDAEQKYLQSLAIIEQARHDIASLRVGEDVNKELISEKEQIIREQEIIVKSLLHNDSSSQSLADKRLKDAEIYNRFVQLSIKGQQPTYEEWEQIGSKIFLCYPGFKEFLSRHEPLINEKEYKTCLLIRIGFKPTNIGLMLGVSSSYITELRSKMLQKLFGMSGTSKMFDKLIRDIY